MSAADPRKGSAGALGDELRFLRGLVARPRTTGAISPSGPALTRAMASHVDPADVLPVIELGPLCGGQGDFGSVEAVPEFLDQRQPLGWR